MKALYENEQAQKEKKRSPRYYEQPIGNGAPQSFLELVRNAVVVKLVHPLADQEIGMSVKVLGVRAATNAEKSAGKAISAPPPPPPR